MHTKLCFRNPCRFGKCHFGATGAPGFLEVGGSVEPPQFHPVLGQLDWSPQGESLDPSPGFCVHCRSDLGAVEVAAKEATRHNEIMEIRVDVAAFPFL